MKSALAPTLTGSFSSTLISGGSVDTSTYLDTAVSSGIQSVTLMAFGFNKMYPGYTGVTAEAKRLSDNATSDFGTDASGRFKKADMISWSGGADINGTKFYDQSGTGKTISVINTGQLVRSNLAKHAATTWNGGGTGQLTLSNTDGSIGLEMLASNTCFLELQNSGLDVTNGIEIHLLFTPLQRKVLSGNVATDQLSGNATQEAWFSLGTASNKAMTCRGPSTNLFMNVVDFSGTGGAPAAQTLGGSGSLKGIKQNGMMVLTQRIGVVGGDMSLYGQGEQLHTATLSAGNISGATSALNNGRLRIGSRYGTGTTGTDYANMLFMGCVITKELTDIQRTALHMRMLATGQHHRVTSKAAVKALFDETIFFKNTNGSGLCAGDNSKTSIQFATGGSATFNLAYTVPLFGLQGVYNPSTSNAANTFSATNSYFATQNTGTVVVMGFTDTTGIRDWFGITTDPADINKLSLSVGNDHAQPRAETKCHSSRDTDLIGANGGTYRSGGISNIAGWTDNTAGLGAQHSKYPSKWYSTHGSYNFPKTTSASVTLSDSTVVASGTSLTNDNLKTEATAVSAYGSWTHFGPPTPEHDSYPSWGTNLNYGDPQQSFRFHAVTFSPGSNYNPAASETSRKPYMLNGKKWSYVSAHDVPIGHRDCSIAGSNTKAAVCDGDPAAKIQNCIVRAAAHCKGAHLAYLFSLNELSLADIETTHVNAYKLLDLENV